ncbi:MAG: hypothetical protein RIE08_08995 [Acidimicrobiales bacterium]
MSFDSITNRGEFFSNHYLDAVMGSDLGDLRSKWKDAEDSGEESAKSRLRKLSARFFEARAAASEAHGTNNRDANRDALKALNDVVLTALGFPPSREELTLVRTTTDELRVSVATNVETGTGLQLVALDAGFATEVDDLFDETEGGAGTLADPLWREGDKRSVRSAADAVGEIFSCDEPPRFVLVCGGRIVMLAERAKWAEGRFLAVDLDLALERMDDKKAGEIETIAALFSSDALIADDGQVVLDELSENSQRHAVGVSKELRHAIRESIEILANEVIDQRLTAKRGVYDGPNAIKADDLTRQSLRWLYRLVVLLYAESRPELGVLPVDDNEYMAGYSLDRLRELCLVDLDTERARNGSHLHESLRLLFELVNRGYHADQAEQSFVFDAGADDQRSHEEYLLFPGLDAALFEEKSTELLDTVTLRNEALQKVLALLMLSPEGKGKDRGFISYAQLGINQIGAVYEGLMAYTGFFADQDLYEVAKDGDPSDGTWVLPVEDAGEYPDDVFVMREDPLLEKKEERVRHPKGSFVFRLSGRDRQRSASYYTPEVLTRCVVKHALAELLGTDDYGPENGSSGITEARDILDVTVCEPALGSGAFLNEAINQLSEIYLKRRQAELSESLDPETYRRELQKVKAHFALHQAYGVDLNATAVELAEISLWLNCMYPGLKAPWLGLQLRRGNSLIGCRRATWRLGQLGDRPWASTKKGDVQPPVDRPLSEGPLDADEIHHFLLPGHGWGAIADRKEAKELRPEETEKLKAWRKRILAAPKRPDGARLSALADAVERLWVAASERVRLTQEALRRPIEVYGVCVGPREQAVSRAEAEWILTDRESPLGRLRLLMDAWVGLWFWPLGEGVEPPSWDEWLAAAGEILRLDAAPGSASEPQLFDDVNTLVEADEGFARVGSSTQDLLDRSEWLRTATSAARREGAWHWELEFSDLFRRQAGFTIQVGNPPWVRPRWYEALVLAEQDPWWVLSDEKDQGRLQERREAQLRRPESAAHYLTQLSLTEGYLAALSSALMRPIVTGLQANLFMVFMDQTWRSCPPRGVVGLLHPDTHIADPKAGRLRSESYHRLRRHFVFQNELQLFEDVDHHTEFAVNVYGSPSDIDFIHMASLFTPQTLVDSLVHDGSGPTPGIQHTEGGWDTRGHADRIVQVDEGVLRSWSSLFSSFSDSPVEARLLRTVTRQDAATLASLARYGHVLDDVDCFRSSGLHEKGAKTDGTIIRRTGQAKDWSRVILQGPHLSVASPFFKNPNENCKNNLDYTEWNLEDLGINPIPRTNYQITCQKSVFESRLNSWEGRIETDFWRLAYRAMTSPSLERSLHAAIIPPGPAHVNAVHTIAFEDVTQTVVTAALWSSLLMDLRVRMIGKSNIQDTTVSRSPAIVRSQLVRPLIYRALRLNCLTDVYAPLWNELLDPGWADESWVLEGYDTAPASVATNPWDLATPLRRDIDRRRALVECDALVAICLGISADQLTSVFRTSFPVLRKYESRTVFDRNGRRISAHHQAAGVLQAEIQEMAKAGSLPDDWKRIWALYETYEEEPEGVDWMGYYEPPFYRPDREREMTQAYEEFQRRLEAGEYD